MLSIGIDIGTSYSSIAILDKDGSAEPIKVSNGVCAFGDSYSMPSAAYVEDNGSVLIGQLAMSSKMRKPFRFKGEFKRDLGQTIPYTIGSLQLMPEDLYKEMFIHFKECAEKSGGEKVSKAYITYPANYGRKKRKLIEMTAKKAGLLEVELIDEPTAAAYCYCEKGKIKEGDKLLVYDFGGGTFDVALIQYKSEGFKPIIDPLGIEKCGGIDIDRMILRDVLNSIPKEIIENIKNDEIAYKRFEAQMMELSVKIKHQLTSTDSYKEAVPVGFDYMDYEITREKLNTKIAPLVEETLAQVKNIVKNANLKMKDVNVILMVGGTSRIPYVQEKLEQLTGKTIHYDIDPELAVCKGAALWKQNTSSIKKDTLSIENDIEAAIEYYKNKKYEKAVKLFNSLAAKDNDVAQYYLGLCFTKGRGVIQNKEKAMYWFESAARKGHDLAQENLDLLKKAQKNFDNRKSTVGECNIPPKLSEIEIAIEHYKNREYEEAAKLFNFLAAKNNDVAQYYLGLCFIKGRGVIQNKEKAMYWFESAARKGHDLAQENLDLLKKVKTNLDDQKSATEQYNLGVCYDNGEGRMQDYKKAVYWYKKAAKRGNANAQNNLGSCYYNGQGVAKDYNKARIWWEKAVEKGHMLAKKNLNVLKKVQANPDDQKSVAEQFNLGCSYHFGKGVKQDYKQAVYWYTKAAEKGDVDAQNNLGFCYKKGYGVTKDYNQAVYWYKKAAEQGNADAQFNLGGCYDNGQGVTKDYKQAVYWYKKAVEQGNASAQCNLGVCYSNGQGVEKDYNQAGIWWEKAAKQGQPTAIDNLKLLKKDATGKYVKKGFLDKLFS